MRPPHQTESGGSFLVRRQFNSSGGYSELVETIDDDGLVVKRRIIVPANKSKPSKPRYALSERNSREETDAFVAYQDELGNRRSYQPQKPDYQKFQRIALAENRLRNEQKTAAESLRQTQKELSYYLTEEPTDEESFLSFPSHSRASYLRLFAGGPASPKVKVLSEQQRKVLLSVNEQLLKEAGGITDDKLSRVMRDAKRLLKTSDGGGNVRRDYSLKIVENLLDGPVKLHEKCLAVIDFVKKRLPKNQNTFSLERAVWDTFAEMSREAQLLAVALYDKLGFFDQDIETAVNEIREKERKKIEAQEEGVQINVQQATPVLGGVSANRAPPRQDRSKLSVKKPKSRPVPKVEVKPVPKIPARLSVDRGNSLDPYYSKIPVAVREQMALKQKTSAKAMVPQKSVTKGIPSAARLTAKAPGLKALAPKPSSVGGRPSSANVGMRKQMSVGGRPSSVNVGMKKQMSVGGRPSSANVGMKKQMSVGGRPSSANVGMKKQMSVGGRPSSANVGMKKQMSVGGRPSSATVGMKKQMRKSASKQKVSPPKIQVEHVKSEYHETPRKPSVLRAHKMARPFMATPPKRSPVPLTPAKVASDSELIAFEEGKLDQKLQQDLEVVKGMVDRDSLTRRVEKMYDKKRQMIPAQIHQLRTPEGQWYGYPHHSPTAHLRVPQAQKAASAAPVSQQLSLPKISKFDPTPLSSLGMRKQRKKMIQPRTLFPQGMPVQEQATPENIAREKQRLQNQYMQASAAAKSQASNQSHLKFQLNTLKAQYDQDLELLEQSQFHERTTIRIPSSAAAMASAASQPRIRTVSPKTIQERLRDHQEIHTTQSKAAEKIQNILLPQRARQTQAQIPQIQAPVPQTRAQVSQTRAQARQTRAQVPQTRAQVPQTRAQVPQTREEFDDNFEIIRPKISATQIYAEKQRLEKEYFASLRSAHQKYTDFLDLANYIRDAKAEYDRKIHELNRELDYLDMPYDPPSPRQPSPPPPRQPSPPPPRQPSPPPKPPAHRPPNLLVASTAEVPVTMRPISEFHADRVEKLRKLHAMAPVQSTDIPRRESLLPVQQQMSAKEFVDMIDDQKEALKLQYFKDIKAGRRQYPDPVEYAYYIAELKDKFDRDLKALDEQYNLRNGTPSIARESLSPAKQSHVASFVEAEAAKIQKKYDEDVKLAISLTKSQDLLNEQLDSLMKTRQRDMTRLMSRPSRDSLAPSRDSLAPARDSLAPTRDSLSPFRDPLAPARGDSLVDPTATPVFPTPALQANEEFMAEKKNLDKNLQKAISHVKRTIPFAVTQVAAVTRLKIQHEKDVAALEKKYTGKKPRSRPMPSISLGSPKLPRLSMGPSLQVQSPSPKREPVQPMLDISQRAPSFGTRTLRPDSMASPPPEVLIDQAKTKIKRRLDSELDEARTFKSPAEYTQHVVAANNKYKEDLQTMGDIARSISLEKTKARQEAEYPPKPRDRTESTTKTRRQSSQPRESLTGLQQLEAEKERLELELRRDNSQVRAKKIKSPYQHYKQLVDLQRQHDKDVAALEQQHSMNERLSLNPKEAETLLRASVRRSRELSKDLSSDIPTQTIPTAAALASTVAGPASTFAASTPIFKVPALPPPVSTGTFKKPAPPPAATEPLSGLELIEAEREKVLKTHRREMAKARRDKSIYQSLLGMGRSMNKRDQALKKLKLSESILNVSQSNLDKTPVLSPRSKSFAMRPVPQIQVEGAEPGQEEQSEEDYNVNMAAYGETPKRKSHLRKLEYIPWRMAPRALRFDPGFTPPKALDDEEYIAAEKNKLENKLQKMQKLAKKLNNPERRLQRAQADYDEGMEELAPERVREWATPGDQWWGFPHYDPALPIRLGPPTPEIEEEEPPLIAIEGDPYQYTPGAGNQRLQLHEKYLQDVEDAKAMIANPTVLQNQLDFLRRTYERDVEAFHEKMMHTPTRSPVGTPHTPTRSPVGPPQTPTRSPVGAMYGPPQTPTRSPVARSQTLTRTPVSHASPVRAAYTSPAFNAEYGEGLFLSADQVNGLMSKADQEYMETIESIENEGNVQNRVQLMMQAQKKRDSEKELIGTFNRKKFEAINEYLKEKDALKDKVPEHMMKFELSILKALLLEEINKLNFAAGLEAQEAIDDEQLAAAVGRH